MTEQEAQQVRANYEAYLEWVRKNPEEAARRARAQELGSGVNDAVCGLRERGFSYVDVLTTLLYEAAGELEDMAEHRLPSTEVAAVVRAVEWLSNTCARTLVQPPPTERRRGH